MSKLVFVMGVQRSGTNSLFDSLTSRAVTPYNESVSSPLFEEMLLRPEPVVRPVLEASRLPVLVKPISESKVRSVRAVLEEFSAHDLRVVWIYRDPINCYASHIQRWSGYRGQSQKFGEDWADRNQSVLDALEHFGDQICLVRYADLIADPGVIASVGDFLSLPARYRFRADSDRGRQVLDSQIIQTLTEKTHDVLAKMDLCRTYLPEHVSPLSRWLARFF